jgi:gliding motility-associated-like protein
MRLFKTCLFSFSLVTILGASQAHAQSWLWATQATGATLASWGDVNSDHCVATDKQGNVFLTGPMVDTLHFGPYTLISPSGNSNYCTFLTKYDVNGNVLWAKESGGFVGGDDALSNSVATDVGGNSYITGSFDTYVGFGSTNLSGYSASLGNIFLTKYDPSGNVVWAVQSNSNRSGDGGAQAESVATDNAGNIFVTGYFDDSLYLGNTVLYTNAYNMGLGGNAFLAKFDPNGNFLWARAAIQSTIYGQSEGSSVATDANGNVYVTGIFVDTISFGALVLKGVTPDLNRGNIFVAKFDPNGNPIWVSQPQQASSASVGFSQSISADASGGVYITGSITDSLTFGNIMLKGGEADVFLVKYACNNGNVIWAKQGVPLDNNRWFGFSVSSDTLSAGGGYLFITCNTDPVSSVHKLRFDTNTFTTSVPQVSSDILLQFDSAGNVICGTVFSEGNEDDGSAVTVDKAGQHVYIGGDIGGDALIGEDSLHGGLDLPFVAGWQICCQHIIAPPGTAHVCKGDTITLSDAGGTSYIWSTSATTSSIRVNPTIKSSYQVTKHYGTCNTEDSTITVNVLQYTIQACCNDSLMSGDSVQLQADIAGYSSFQWLPTESLACNTCPDPTVTPLTSTYYFLEATDTNGCRAIDSVYIKVYEDCGFFIPNAFTPNNDTKNDSFAPYGICIVSYSMLIFDRWGNTIYSTNNSEPWDGKYNGKKVPEDTYVYQVTIIDINQQPHTYNGRVTVLK